MAWLKRTSRTPADLIATAILPLIAHTINHDVISIELYLLANSSETPSVCAMFHMTRMEMGCFRHKYAKSPFSCNFRIILYSVAWIFPIVAFDVIMSYNTIRNLYSLPWIYFNHTKQGQKWLWMESFTVGYLLINDVYARTLPMRNNTAQTSNIMNSWARRYSIAVKLQPIYNIVTFYQTTNINHSEYVIKYIWSKRIPPVRLNTANDIQLNDVTKLSGDAQHTPECM